jgi:hypothetical protein
MPMKKVLSLEGSSTIIEIPLDVKYNFLPRKRSNFFATAGLMSYLLTDEKNDYILLVNGAEMNTTTRYTEASRYFAAALNVSAGYEVHLRNSFSLRINPYVQMPLRGIGVGTMRVMSTGIHFGVTRLFKWKPKTERPK